MQKSKAIISLKNIAMTYEGGVKALLNINFDIHKGESVSIMGKSGSGKSTLLNILGCLDSPSEGSYCFNGQDVSKLSDNELSDFRNRNIGFIFQSFNLISQLNVIENVEVPLFYMGINRRKRRKISMKFIEQVGLKDRAYHIPQKLSGGERQRVAIARALVEDPEVLLADEPTGNLDSKTGKEIMEMLVCLNKEKNMTLIMVTHDQKIGKSFPRTIEILDGKLNRDIKRPA